MKDAPGQCMNIIFCGVLPDWIKLAELPTQGVILKQLSQKAAFHSSQLISLFWSSGAKEPPSHLMLTVRSLWVQFRLRLQWSLGMVISRHPRYIAIRYVWSLSFHREKKRMRSEEKKRFFTTFKTVHLWVEHKQIWNSKRVYSQYIHVSYHHIVHFYIFYNFICQW